MKDKNKKLHYYFFKRRRKLGFSVDTSVFIVEYGSFGLILLIPLKKKIQILKTELICFNLYCFLHVRRNHQIAGSERKRLNVVICVNKLEQTGTINKLFYFLQIVCDFHV